MNKSQLLALAEAKEKQNSELSRDIRDIALLVGQFMATRSLPQKVSFFWVLSNFSAIFTLIQGIIKILKEKQHFPEVV